MDLKIELNVWMMKRYLEKIKRDMEEEEWMEGDGRGKKIVKVLMKIWMKEIEVKEILKFINEWKELVVEMKMMRRKER